MTQHLILSAWLSCSLVIFGQQGDVPKSGDLAKMAWLQGRWYLMKAKPGQTTDEYWKKISTTEWQGEGVTIQGKDTVFVEKLKLVDDGKNIYYIADIKENAAPVPFKFVAISESGFVCENPEHDFPKKIEYQKKGDVLTATISGNGKSIAYVFVRK